MEYAKTILKAIIGFIAPGAVVIGASVTPQSLEGTHIAAAEWVTALVACVITSAGVWAAPNKDATGTHQTESVQPPSA